MTKIQRQVSSAREGLKNVRNGMSVFREWMTDMHTTTASMVHRIQEAKKKNENTRQRLGGFIKLQ